MAKLDYGDIPSPCYILEEDLLRKNLEIIQQVSDRAGVEVILALKGFAMWSTFPIIKEYVKGATASSLNELKLCQEEMKEMAHSYFVAYGQDEFDEVVAASSHVTFNSLSQYNQFKDQVKKSTYETVFGLRINPEYSEVSTVLYNPSSPTSRLGITLAQMPDELPEGITGLHFHVLCESDSFALENTLKVFERKFGHYLKKVSWINFGGGHLMTRADYDIEHLVQVLKDFREKHKIDIILEPGSAFAWQAGKLLTTVVDIVENGDVRTAIINASFTCHMPDCLEMPYKPVVTGCLQEGEAGEQYVLGGLSCLAGDFVAGYTFPEKLKIGDHLIFEDMIHYTMVKTSTFNGIEHPDIGIVDSKGKFQLIRKFGYEDFKSRLS